MITCANCGEGNPPDTEFCGKCGTFLNWRAEEPTPVGAAAATDAEIEVTAASALPPDGVAALLRWS